MCLSSSKLLTDQKRQEFEKYPTQTFYKVYRFNRRRRKDFYGQFQSPVMDTKVIINKYPGCIVSTRTDTSLSYVEEISKQIKYGIHVFIHESEAHQWTNQPGQCDNLIVVKVTGKKEDFVAAGSMPMGKDDVATAVFTKIYYTPEDVEKAITDTGQQWTFKQ